MNDTTIVTFFLDIGRDTWSTFRRDTISYLNSLNKLCEYDWPLIIYLDSSLKEENLNLGQARVEYVDMDWLCNNTHAFQQQSDLEKIMQSEEYKLNVAHRLHHPENSNHMYNVIQNVKIDLLVHACEQGWINTPYAAWMDAGFFIQNIAPPLGSILSCSSLMERHQKPVVYSSVEGITKNDMDPMWTLIHAPFKVCGCMFIIESDNIHWFQDIYHQSVSMMMDLGIVDDDQGVVTHAFNITDLIGLEILTIPHSIIRNVTFNLDKATTINDFMSREGWKEKTSLCEILERNGSDKGGTWHNYSSLYHELFKGWIDKDVSVFELGIGSNNLDVKSNMGSNGVPLASLRSWREYFGKNALIRSADIDKRILMDEDQIRTFYCDQNNRNSIMEMWQECDIQQFDIIIDDALHEFNANLSFLMSSYDKLKPGGLYIIEDCTPETLNRFRTVFVNFEKFWAKPKLIKIASLPHNINMCDNNLIIIQK
jgi:hypothetical protein